MIGQASLFPPDTTGKLRTRVSVDLVPSSVARHVLETFHYLHRARTGCQMHYAVSVDGVIDGVISYAFPMTSAPICGVPSDELVEFARMYLHSNIPHSATCAIGQTLKRVKADWAMTNPAQKPIRMVVSWSDCTLHTGIIYRASNFAFYNHSDGRRGGNHGPNTIRGKRIMQSDRRRPKDCWIYWIDAKDRKRGEQP